MIDAKIFQRFLLFSELDTIFLEELSAIGEEKVVENGNWVFHERSNAEAFYLIVKGGIELKLNLDPKRSTYATLNTLTEGNAFGWSAMAEPYVYKFGAVASDSTQLVSFDAKQLRELLERHPEQGYLLMQGVAQAMATRVSVLSEQAPDLSFRFFLASILLILSIATGVLFAVFVFSVLYAATSGHLEGIIMLPFCLVIPVTFFLTARYLYPALFEVTNQDM